MEVSLTLLSTFGLFAACSTGTHYTIISKERFLVAGRLAAPVCMRLFFRYVYRISSIQEAQLLQTDRVILNISLSQSHSRSFEMTLLNRACISRY